MDENWFGKKIVGRLKIKCKFFNVNGWKLVWKKEIVGRVKKNYQQEYSQCLLLRAGTHVHRVIHRI